MAPLRLSLAHLTVLDAHPLELIDAAAAGGFNSVGLRIVAPMANDRIVPVIGDEALTRQIERKLADTGIDILDVEAIWLTPDSDVSSYIPTFETGARLGARHVLMVGNDPDEARVIDNFAHMCTLAAPFGLKFMLEFIPYCQTATVEAAHRVVTRAGQPNSGVLVDALHRSRSGGSPADLEILDPAWLSYCQICDARAARPTEVAELRNEARTGRLYPGQGTLPLTDLLDALPEGIPLGVEAPYAEYADRSPIERGKLCGASTHRFLDEYRQHRAGVGRRVIPSTGSNTPNV
jgi:sugar phosphate isomerase/epimerase